MRTHAEHFRCAVVQRVSAVQSSAARSSSFFKLCGGTLGTAATTGLLYQPWMIGEGDCGKIGGMKIGRET
jgi:hypothetical protein